MSSVTPGGAVDNLIPTVDTTVNLFVSEQDRAGRKTIRDMVACPTRHQAFSELLQSLIRNDEGTALSHGAEGHFKIMAIKHRHNRYLAVSDAHHPDQGPTIILNSNPKIDLIAGAHRCASRTHVRCDGKTRTCGHREAYRTSDTAHKALTSAWPRSIVLSLHGMRRDDKGVRTSVVLSNGIRSPDQEKSTSASRLRTAMTSALPEEGAVVSCNIPDDRKYKFRRLCGTTNVQGRMVNGDGDVCIGNMTQGTGRFIHIEQDRAVRNPFVSNWRGVDTNRFIQHYLNAIASVAPPIK